MRSALQRLALGSDAYDFAYADAMDRIHSQRKGDVELAVNVLTWIVGAKTPLSATELQCVLAFEPETSSLDTTNFVDVEEILLVCAGLVTQDPTTAIVRLVHYTTQDFLERHRDVWIPNADWHLANSCISYLGSGCFHSSPNRLSKLNDRSEFDQYSWLFSLFRQHEGLPCPRINTLLENNPLATYAAESWHEHLRDVENKWNDLAEDQRTLTLDSLDSLHLLDWCWGAMTVDRYAQLRSDPGTRDPMKYFLEWPPR